MVQEGRRPGLLLQQDADTQISLLDWAASLMEQCRQVAQALDDAHGTDAYLQSIEGEAAKLTRPEMTPSARVLAAMQAEEIPFFRFSMNRAVEHAQALRGNPLSADQLQHMQQLAKQSFDDQRAIEAADAQPFAQFLKDYLAI